jgi:MinD-like ATPase involved in chromosome partitioning or flagellar assembly
MSSDPSAPGIAELVRGAASFGDAITRDQFSRVHLVATGNPGRDAAAIAASPNLPVAIEALARSYDHVVLDIGATTEIMPEQFVALAPNAVLVGAGPLDAATKAARDRLATAGFRDVKTVVGGSQPVAA